MSGLSCPVGVPYLCWRWLDLIGAAGVIVFTTPTAGVRLANGRSQSHAEGGMNERQQE